jgi:hypothetical protein
VGRERQEISSDGRKGSRAFAVNGRGTCPVTYQRALTACADLRRVGLTKAGQLMARQLAKPAETESSHSLAIEIQRRGVGVRLDDR